MAVTSQGTCVICTRVLPKNQMTRHLAQCAGRSGEGSPWFHILVEGLYARGYWLHLRASPRATLADLDSFLRDIWLECCGHLSEFRIGEGCHVSDRVDDACAEHMNVTLGRILAPGAKLTYTYDFGSSTELSLRVVAERHGPRTKEKIALLARNQPPHFACDNCGAPALRVCSECSWSGSGYLCGECADSHECGSDMLLPLVNSPRAGVCGYTG